MCDKCKCISLLQRRRIGVTELRRYIIKVLTLAGRSLTPAEILRGIRKIRHMNKVTLYRIIGLLEEEEIIRSISTSDGVIRYALIDPLDNGKRNLAPHFFCRKCKTIMSIDSSDIRSFIEKKMEGKFSGPFELTVEGICLHCRKESDDHL